MQFLEIRGQSVFWEQISRTVLGLINEITIAFACALWIHATTDEHPKFHFVRALRVNV